LSWSRTNPSAETTWRTASIGERSEWYASTDATSVSPFLRGNENTSTSPAFSSRPLTTAGEPTAWAFAGSSFGSFSVSSGSVPTTNGRSVLAPWAS
jgi:hypothetical protein